MSNSTKTHGKLNIFAVLIITAMIIGALGYFGINLRSIVDSAAGQENIATLVNTVTNVWHNYLAGPVLHFWNDIWIPMFWHPFLENMQHIQNGEPTDWQNFGGNLTVPF